MIKSRTSSTSLIPNPPLSAALRASEPLQFGARSPKRHCLTSSLRQIGLFGLEFAQLTMPVVQGCGFAHIARDRVG